MSDYRALAAYTEDEAATYDGKRFGRPRGRIVDALEWRLLRRGLGLLVRRGAVVRDVADVPVGTGRMAARLIKARYEVVGVDVSTDMLKLAQGRSAAPRYVVGRAEALPLADGSVDAVVSVRLFGHLPQDARAAALAEFARVARIGAVVFYAGDTRWLRLRRRAETARDTRPLDAWFPVAGEQMSAEAIDAGFEIVGNLRLLGPISETRAIVLESRRSG